MLTVNENCATTTDLANSFYFTRIAELEEILGKDKVKFNELLAEE